MKVKKIEMKPLSILPFLSILVGCFSAPPIKTGLEGEVLPSFNILLMDTKGSLNTANISSKQPNIFLLFSPSCPHCRALTKNIVDNIKEMKNIHFYVISPVSFDQIKKYYDYFNLGKYTNITVARDSGNYFARYFKTQSVPFLAIYNSDKRLKQVLMGEVDTKEIEDAVRN
jgi:thiol-disulfide isomerase/thioredoxin